MKIMIAYDGSRNAKLALAQVVNMFRCNQPLLVLVGVVENPLDATDNNEALFQQEHDEVKRHLQEGVAFAIGEGFQDLLVIARHSHQPDGGIIAKSLTYFVDELDYMTFGSVSSFLARRAECPLLILPSP